MDCDRCVYKSRKYPSRCALLRETDVSWDCTTTLEDYKNILREQVEYYQKKQETTRDSLESAIYNREYNKCRKELESLEV